MYCLQSKLFSVSYILDCKTWTVIVDLADNVTNLVYFDVSVCVLL